MQSRVRHSISNKFQGKNIFIGSANYWRPVNFIVTPIPGGNRLTWNDVSWEEGYEIWVSTNNSDYSLLAITNANVVTYDDLVTTGMASYQIRAFKGDEYSDFSDEVQVLDYPNAPSGLTLSRISGGIKIDWTDNSSSAAKTEVWGKSNAGGYALLYTINAGIVTKNDLLNPVDLRYYKLRAIVGTYTSAFTAEVSIAMLGANLVTNGGASGSTDWVDSNSDGLADGFSISAGTPSIVTGNGFTGNAQRLSCVAGTVRFYIPNLTAGKKYYIAFKYRSTVSGSIVRVYTNNLSTVLGLLNGNTGNALLVEIYTGVIATGGITEIWLSSVGFMELDELIVKEVL